MRFKIEIVLDLIKQSFKFSSNLIGELLLIVMLFPFLHQIPQLLLLFLGSVEDGVKEWFAYSVNLCHLFLPAAVGKLHFFQQMANLLLLMHLIRLHFNDDVDSCS
jgi:hypothetical protein